METNKNRAVPYKALHPGEVLREELKSRGISQKKFAEIADIQPSHLNEFIKGKRNLNEDLAIKLEKHLSIPFEVWMNLHNGYLYDCKAIANRNADEHAAIEFEKSCSQIFNLRLLYQRLGIHSLNCTERVRSLKEMFPADLHLAKF